MRASLDHPQRPKRIFLGTVEIAGFYTYLAAALRGVGADCTFVELQPHPFHYPGEQRAPLPACVRWVRRAAAFRQARWRKPWPWRAAAVAGYVLETLLRILLVLPWAAARFDVFCFGFGSNLVGTRLGYWDIMLLRVLGKRIVFAFHGADSRPPYLTGPYVRLAQSRGHGWAAELARRTRRQKRSMRSIERWAHVTIDVPVHGHFHSRAFVDYNRLGSPRATPPVTASVKSPARDAGPVRVLHAPSDRAAKGSDVIAGCIELLRREGHEIDYRELHGLSHDDVLSELDRCDFVIDQLYADYPLAGFASEAASRGKPAIVCGYLKESERAPMPTLYGHPDELRACVERLLCDHEYRVALGEQARRFMESTWSPDAVARRWMRVFDDDIPLEWWVDPARTTYLYGGGMSEAALKQALAGLIAYGGPGALGLDDKPALRDALVVLAGTPPAFPSAAMVADGGPVPRRN